PSTSADWVQQLHADDRQLTADPVVNLSPALALEIGRPLGLTVSYYDPNLTLRTRLTRPLYASDLTRLTELVPYVTVNPTAFELRGLEFATSLQYLAIRATGTDGLAPLEVGIHRTPAGVATLNWRELDGQLGSRDLRYLSLDNSTLPATVTRRTD